MCGTYAAIPSPKIWADGGSEGGGTAWVERSI
jgi:hypothetical protein